MKRVREVAKKFEVHSIITLLIVLFVVIFFADRIFVVIEPGHAGVIFRPLFGGTVIDHTYSEGLHILFPWNRMYSYNLRVQETTRTLTALTSDGMSVKLDLSIRYHPDASMVGLLHANVGPDYLESVVVPEVLGVVRANVAQKNAEQLVSGDEAAAMHDLEANALTAPATPPVALAAAPPGTVPTGPVLPSSQVASPPAAISTPVNQPAPAEKKAANLTLEQIVEGAGENVSRKYVIVDAVVLIKTILPDGVQAAIEQKIEAKQFSQTQIYRLAAARQDTEIKKQEAASNDALRASITPPLLMWKGIEATKELAASPNSKVIFIGNSPNGLPVILGSEKSP
jgi:regulator of protease activity HflC (stomatin/prohibitin superfamily)